MKHAVTKKKPLEKSVKAGRKSSLKISKNAIQPIEKINFVKIARNLKSAPTGVVKRAKTAEKNKADVSTQSPKPKKEKIDVVVAAAAAAESKSKTAKKVGASISVKKANKKAIAAGAVSVKKAASKMQKVAIDDKPKREKSKTKSDVATSKIELKKKKVISVAATQKAAPKAKKVEAAKSEPKAKNAKTIAPIVKSQTKISKLNPTIINGKSKIEKIETAAKKTQSKKTAPPAEDLKKSKKEKLKLVILPQKVKLVEPEIEAKSLPVRTKPKKTKPIGAAVFRGRRERYDFQVYPLDAVFDNVSAIYIISKRKIDRNRRGHHALVCIGQTDSIAVELKKHTQSKCVKKHQANVISILPEASEKKRLKIEEDLKAAHSITCNLG